MPVASITEARDLVLDVLKAAWDAIPGAMPLYYEEQDVDTTQPPYAEADIRYGLSGPNSVGNETGVRYNQAAALVVDIYVEYGLGMEAADAYIRAVQSAFIGQKTIPDKVWFRSVTPATLPRKGRKAHHRVVVNFEYDELF